MTSKKCYVHQKFYGLCGKWKYNESHGKHETEIRIAIEHLKNTQVDTLAIFGSDCEALLRLEASEVAEADLSTSKLRP